MKSQVQGRYGGNSLLRPDDGPILFTKLSPDSLRIIQTQLGGGHLFDEILYKISLVCMYI
jgi:hypothetical protein